MGNIINCTVENCCVYGKNTLTPVGTMMIYVNNSAPPAGWLFCNGQSISKNDYQDLYTIIGTTFGGDGNPNFNVPNLINRIPLGASQLSPTQLGNPGGALNHTHTLNHSHGMVHNHQISHNHALLAHNHNIANHNHTMPSHNHSIDSHRHDTTHYHSGTLDYNNSPTVKYNPYNLAKYTHTHSANSNGPTPYNSEYSGGTTANNTDSLQNLAAPVNSGDSISTEMPISGSQISGDYSGNTSQDECESLGANPPFLSLMFIIKY